MKPVRPRALGSAAALVLAPFSFAQVAFDPPTVVSVDGPAVAGAADPGGEASKAKIVSLFRTPMGRHDGRLVVVWGDVNHSLPIWDPQDGEHLPRDIYAAYSDDDGLSWTSPVNLSNTARLFSARTDWNADGVREEFYGDSDKPTVFANGDNVVVTWVDKYAPEASWTFGASGESTVQGTASYPDLAVYPQQRVVPFSAVWAAVSNDGGSTWQYGHTNPPLQLTYGRRDAIGDVHKGSGVQWVMAWQEDPAGLQPGEAEGPGEGGSGAHTTAGTDVWYTWTTDIVARAADLRTNRTPLTDHSSYDTTGTNGYPLVGEPGSIENHGASRPNIDMVRDGTVFRAVVAYEETKGPGTVNGKTIQYHAFPFAAPIVSGAPEQRYGDGGYGLSPLLENSRRVRFVLQQPNGIDAAIAIFWRQGVDGQGAPADIVLKTSTSLDGAGLAAATALNLSCNTPTATPADLLASTTANPYEEARAHRAYLRGQLLVVGWAYTPNGPVARYTNLENYNFWIRRSTDGGQTWLAPQDLSHIADKTINVKEPRLVGPARTGTEDPDSFVVAWGTETNVYEGLEVPEALDIFITRTHDQGVTFEPVMPLAATASPEYECQLRVDDDVSEVSAVWMEDDGTADAMFASGGHPILVQVAGSPVPPGGFVNLTFRAPGFENALYVAAASFGTRPGIALPWGTLPLNWDPLFQLSLVVPTAFVNFQGIVGPLGTAAGIVNVPRGNALLGTSFYVAFLAIPASGPWGISTAGLIRIE